MRTIRELKKEESDRKVYFIIGGDSLEWLDKWVEADELLKNTHFITVIRGKTDLDKTKSIIKNLKNVFPYSQIDILNMPDTPISSTDIRNRIRNGESVEGLIPDSLVEYIKNNKLYLCE